MKKYAWNENIYDVLSLDYFYINDIDKAIENVKKAMKINPENERIKNNYEIMKSAKND